MTDDRKPKDMIGLRDHQGRSSLGLSDTDHPLVWVRRKRVTVEARNKGGHLTVRPSDLAVLDGYYSLGTKNGALHVVGSPTARGNFTDRGVFGINVGGSANNADMLRYLGRGWGFAGVFGPPAFTADFNNQSIVFWSFTEYQTRIGKTFEARYFTYMVGQQLYTAYMYYTGPSVLKQGKEHAWLYNSLSYIDIDRGDQTYKAKYIIDFGTYGLEVTLTTDKYQILQEFGSQVSGPRSRFGWLIYYRPEYRQHPEIPPPTGGTPGPPLPHPIDVMACKGFVFQFSDDYGQSWNAASSASILQEYTDTVLPITEEDSNGVPHGRVFNAANAVLSPQIAPISLRYSVIVMSVPEVHWSADDPPRASITAKAKIGLVDNYARTVTETGVLYEDTATDLNGQRARTYLLGGIMPVEGGACFMVKPQDVPNPGSVPGYIYFTSNGTDIDKSAPPMPFPANCTGYLFSLDAKTLGCVMFDGKYSLYESKDRGKTWTRRATVAEAPLHSNNAYLLEFATVVQLRDNNAPADAMPGAPWAGDERKDPPIL